MHKMFSALLVSTFLTILPITVVADEAEMKAQVEEISLGLVERLPMDQKIVLKALSPEQSGLPENFLRKLTSDLEAALLIASDFEINLANRLSTEELWSEAVEFGDADFEDLYEASQADVMLMLTPRATGAGVEISLTAYRLIGDNAGQVIASSGSVVLAMDVESSLGVDVNSLNDQMAQVLQEIEKVGQTGGLITSPKTYAEYYHNARILQQRGEIDLAISNYEAALEVSPFPFVDPVEDLVGLAEVKYGRNLNSYVEKKLSEILSRDLHSYARWLVNPKNTQISVEDLAIDGKVFLPLVFVWLEQNKKLLEEKIRAADVIGDKDYNSLFLLLEASRKYLNALSTGELQNYYIDKLRASTAISQSELRNLIEEFSFFSYSVFETDYEYGTGNKTLVPLCETQPCTFPDSAIGIPSLGMEAAGIPTPYVDKVGEVKYFDAIVPTPSALRAAFPKIDANVVEDVLLSFDFLTQSGNTQYLGEDFQKHMGPCGSVFHKSSYSREDGNYLIKREDSAIQSGANIGNSEKIIAPYEQLILADLCIDLWANSSQLSTDVMLGRLLNFSNTKQDFSLEYGIELHSNANRLSGTSIHNNWSSFKDEVVDSFVQSRKTLFKLNGLQGLLISDNVDKDFPVELIYGLNEYVGANTWNVILGVIDVTKDGSFIDYDGMPFNPKFRDNWKMDGAFAEISRVNNKWFYIPGIIQGSIGLDEPYVFAVKYTDRLGVEKVITNPKVTLPVGEYFPDGPVGYFSSEACLTNDNCEELKNYHSRSFEETLCGYRTLECVSEFSLPRLASFSFIRHKLFHSDDLLYSDDGQNASQNARNATNNFKNIFFQLDLNSRMAVQSILQRQGLYRDSVDGRWGQNTENAVNTMFGWYFEFLEGEFPKSTQDYINVVIWFRDNTFEYPD